MNEQYLWDQTTEPDEETKEIESLLSEFCYQPRPLLLPVEPKRFFVFDYRIAAIAATVLIAVGLLFWLSFRNKSSQEIVIIPQTAPTQVPVIEQKFVASIAPVRPQLIVNKLNKQRPNILKSVLTHHRINRPSMAVQERMAKDKLMFALQLTSDKLDFIQHKISVDSNE